MKRRLLLPLLAVALCAALPGSAPRAADAQEAVSLRIATLAPNGSSWMRVFNAWNQSLRQATNNTLSLRFYPGGSQGDERDYIRKVRAGQMDGAIVTSTGLGMIVRPVLVLTAPGLFTEYEQIDSVRDSLADEFERQFQSNGYELLGWGDVGKMRIFSQEAVARPSDFRNRRPWAWRDELVYTELLNVIGANPVALGVNEVYPALQTRMVDTVPASALAAISLQWYTRVQYMTQQSLGILLGATIISKDKVDALTPDQRRALMETAERAHRALQTAIRRDDERARTSVISRGIRQVDIAPYQSEWDQVAAETRQRLTGRVWPASLLQRVESALNN